MHEEIAVFAFADGLEFGSKVGRELGIALTALEQRDFEDGEHKSRSLENIRNRDVFIIQSLYGDAEHSVNDKLCRLLFFIGALKDASAKRVTAVLPYLCYARKDRKTKTRDPVITRYVAMLFEAVGTERVVVVDVHNLAAFQNAFRCHADHLEAGKLFVNHFVPLLADQEVIVVSPDIGGIKRADRFREALTRRLGRPVGSAFMEKRRSAGVVSGEAVVGDVRNTTAIIVDDLISTGNTIARTVHACRERGANKVYAVATHGIFVGEPERLLSTEGLEGIVVTNSIPAFRLDPEIARDKLTVIDIAPLVADAIKAIHSGGSIVELLDV